MIAAVLVAWLALALASVAVMAIGCVTLFCVLAWRKVAPGIKPYLSMLTPPK